MTPEQMRRAASLLDADAAELRLDGMGDDGEWYMDEDGYTDRHAYDELIDLARLLREQAEAMGWRDIATAPRDGTEILCWDGRARAICAFREGKWDVVHDAESDLWPRYEPTQWRTLPPPPEGGK